MATEKREHLWLEEGDAKNLCFFCWPGVRGKQRGNPQKSKKKKSNSGEASLVVDAKRCSPLQKQGTFTALLALSRGSAGTLTNQRMQRRLRVVRLPVASVHWKIDSFQSQRGTSLEYLLFSHSFRVSVQPHGHVIRFLAVGFAWRVDFDFDFSVVACVTSGSWVLMMGPTWREVFVTSSLMPTVKWRLGTSVLGSGVSVAWVRRGSMKNGLQHHPKHCFNGTWEFKKTGEKNKKQKSLGGGGGGGAEGGLLVKKAFSRRLMSIRKGKTDMDGRSSETQWTHTSVQRHQLVLQLGPVAWGPVPIGASDRNPFRTPSTGPRLEEDKRMGETTSGQPVAAVASHCPMIC